MSHVHQSKELAETHLYIMIPHSGKWEEIGERADNEANGRAIQWAPQKTLFRDAVMSACQPQEMNCIDYMYLSILENSKMNPDSGFIFEFLPYFPTLINTYSWYNSFLECYVESLIQERKL